MAELFGSNNPLTSQLVALAMPKSSSKKPNKSTAVTARARTDYNPTIAEDDLIKANARRSKKDSFTVKYYVGEKNGKADELTFNFALLPAIDNIVNYSASGPFRGNESVPEVKPGIPIRTAMKHRNTVIPGGTNVVQTIGIDSKYIVLVGAFVGTEKSTSGAPVGSTYYDTIYQRVGNPKEQLPEYSSYKQAKFFNDEVVEKGAPVNIAIQTTGQKVADSIKVTGVIVDFKIQAVREAKTYYAMTVLYTDQSKPNKTKISNKVALPVPASKASSSNIPNPKADDKTPSSTKVWTSEEVVKLGLVGRDWNDKFDKELQENYGFIRVQNGKVFDTAKNEDGTVNIRRYSRNYTVTEDGEPLSGFVDFVVEKKPLFGVWYIKEATAY